MVPFRRRLSTLSVVWLDVFAYAGTVAAASTVLALAIGIATGGGIVRGKAVLFLIGWLVLAYATARLWPTSPEDIEHDRTETGRFMPEYEDASLLQRVARRTPPARWIRQPKPVDRVSPTGKLFVAGCLVLIVSFLMETAFGVV